jgi:hypothetical protein
LESWRVGELEYPFGHKREEVEKVGELERRRQELPQLSQLFPLFSMLQWIYPPLEE